MRNSIKKYFVYLITYLIISIGYLIYYYLREGVLNMDYIRLSIFTLVIYSITYYLLNKFVGKS